MSAFFGENSPAWSDMSDYVVHFAKDSDEQNAHIA